MSSMIRIQKDVKTKLDSLKAYPKESYNDTIKRILDIAVSRRSFQMRTLGI